MLVGTYRGLNAHVFHPLKSLFLREPSWVPNFNDANSYLEAVKDPCRVHPTFPNAVFDTPEQVFERWRWIESDPNLYIVSLTVRKKEDEPPSGGWRWHKWGDYLGDKEPQCEYLYDEPEITQATVTDIFEIDTSKPGAREVALDFMEGTNVGWYEEPW